MGKYFTLNELIYSATAELKKIDNIPNGAIKKNLEILIEQLDKIREKWGKPIYINSGYRCPELNKAVKGVDSSQHCFDQNTEILTNNGWKTIHTLKSWDKPYSYNLETEKIELDSILEIISRPFDGNLYYADNRHINYAVTDEHRMLVRTEEHKYKRKTNREFTEKGKKYFDSLKTNNNKFHIELAKDVYKRRRIFKCAGISNGTNEYDINILKMCMAVIADGYLTATNTNHIGIGFNLVKERDKTELEEILKNLNWPYTKNYSKLHEKQGQKNVYTYFINSTTAKEIYQIIGRDKKIPNWFLSLKPEILRQLIITYAKFDGTIDTRNNNQGIVIFSKEEDNIDKLQIMSIFSNMRCVKKTFRNYEINIQGKHYVLDKFYHLYITQNTNESKVMENLHKVFYYNGPVWCIRTKNTTVITRRNGKISIQGNCLGCAADLDTRKGLAENKKLYNLIVNNFKYDQVFLENKGAWIHYSYVRPNRHLKGSLTQC